MTEVDLIPVTRAGMAIVALCTRRDMSTVLALGNHTVVAGIARTSDGLVAKLSIIPTQSGVTFIALRCGG